MPIAEIFSQGDEVVTGEIADTNAAWLSQELIALGFEIARHTAVGDRLEALVELLREIAGRADLCVCTGGLGPTCDDLTAEAVGLAFGLPLAMDPEAMVQIEAWFTRMGRPMPEVNRKQAWLPKGAERLDNLWGTAPGFAVRGGRCRFVFMPGVPSEMKAMFRHWIQPDLPRRFELRPARRVVLRTAGVGESTLQERLNEIALPSDVGLGFHAGGPENRVKLRFPADFPDAMRDEAVRRAVAAIGEAVYAVGSGDESEASLETVVGRALVARGSTLYAVETVSGGALANRCAGEDWFAGAAVAFDGPALLSRFGVAAESAPADAARRLAESARKASGADYALVQHGEFGRAGLRAEDGRVEVYFALAGPEGTRWESRIIGGPLARKKQNAATLGLDFVRRCLA
ncbi:competence/damage-inducible protein A [Methylomagnum sp.]